MGLQKKIIQFICYFVKHYITVICYDSNADMEELANFSDNKIPRSGIFCSLHSCKRQIFMNLFFVLQNSILLGC